MSRPALVVYVLAMVVVVVGVDVAFFRERPWLWQRLMVNVGIVLVFGAFYLRLFLQRS
jgi:nucleoside recognition membrane protein YjiH